MDIKEDRRNFYETKTFLANKYEKEYTTQKFSDQIQQLLDDYIPNATLKQLVKFMDKKYNRIIKDTAEVQKPLNKVLRDKFNRILSDLKKTQIQKILSFIENGYDDMQFVCKGQNQYHLLPKKGQLPKRTWNNRYEVEGITFWIPSYISIMVDTRHLDEKGYYRINCLNPKNKAERCFVSVDHFQPEKFSINKGNFEREANKFLEKLDSFSQILKSVQKPQKFVK